MPNLFFNFTFCVVLETGSHVDKAGLESHVAKDNLKFFLLPPPPTYWDCGDRCHYNYYSPFKVSIFFNLGSHVA